MPECCCHADWHLCWAMQLSLSYSESCYAECCYTECHLCRVWKISPFCLVPLCSVSFILSGTKKPFLLSATMLTIVMLSINYAEWRYTDCQLCWMSWRPFFRSHCLANVYLLVLGTLICMVKLNIRYYFNYRTCSPFQPCLMFVRPGAYPRLEHWPFSQAFDWVGKDYQGQAQAY